MSKILKVGDKAYKDDNMGLSSITVVSTTPKRVKWSNGTMTAIDTNRVKSNSPWHSYDVPQTEAREKEYADKLRFQQLKYEASSLYDAQFKKLNADQLQQLITLLEGFKGGKS